MTTTLRQSKTTGERFLVETDSADRSPDATYLISPPLSSDDADALPADLDDVSFDGESVLVTDGSIDDLKIVR
jgi:hypothetical protein